MPINFPDSNQEDHSHWIPIVIKERAPYLHHWHEEIEVREEERKKEEKGDVFVQENLQKTEFLETERSALISLFPK